MRNIADYSIVQSLDPFRMLGAVPSISGQMLSQKQTQK